MKTETTRVRVRCSTKGASLLRIILTGLVAALIPTGIQGADQESVSIMLPKTDDVVLNFAAQDLGRYLKQMTGEQITILKVDIDKNPALASSYQIQSVPTLILFQSGKVKWRQSGVVQARQLHQVIETAIKS